MSPHEERERLLRVIQALRRHTVEAGCTPQQAAAYQAKADALAAKHNVTADELHIFEQMETAKGRTSFRMTDVDLDEFLKSTDDLDYLAAMFMLGMLPAGVMATKVGGIRKMNARGHLHWAITFYAAKEGYHRQEYADFCNGVKYHPRDTKVKRYVTIGRRASRLNADIDKLPDAFDTLWKLACLTDEQYAWVRDDPRFNPSMKASDIKTILRTPHMGGKFNYVPEPFEASGRAKQEAQPTFFGDCNDMSKEDIRRLYAKLKDLKEEFLSLSLTLSPKFKEMVGDADFDKMLFSKKFDKMSVDSKVFAEFMAKGG